MYDGRRGDIVFWKQKNSQSKRQQKEKRKQVYERVLQLHKHAAFLFYVDDVILELYHGQECVKLVGTVAIGNATLDQSYELYSCTGIKKADIEVEEFYVGADAVKILMAGDKTVAIYPRQSEVSYKAGDVLCKLHVCGE